VTVLLGCLLGWLGVGMGFWALLAAVCGGAVLAVWAWPGRPCYCFGWKPMLRGAALWGS